MSTTSWRSSSLTARAANAPSESRTSILPNASRGSSGRGRMVASRSRSIFAMKRRRCCGSGGPSNVTVSTGAPRRLPPWSVLLSSSPSVCAHAQAPVRGAQRQQRDAVGIEHVQPVDVAVRQQPALRADERDDAAALVADGVMLGQLGPARDLLQQPSRPAERFVDDESPGGKSGSSIGERLARSGRRRTATLGRVPTIPQRELRNNVSEVLRRAEQGERFTITVAGRPVAEARTAGSHGSWRVVRRSAAHPPRDAGALGLG